MIFTLVTVVIVYCAWRFRAKPGDDSDGPPIHGNTQLEIVWTIVPTVLLAVMAVWAYLVLSDNEALASDRLVVEVTAEQFVWELRQPRGGHRLRATCACRTGRQVELRMRSQDVIHDFYVKEFRVKQDVVPGITTQADRRPRPRRARTRSSAPSCAASGHGLMRARVIVMEPADYEAWVTQAQTTSPPGPPARPAAGARAGAPPRAQGATAPAPEGRADAVTA